jgi:hypothetical protein
VSTTSAETLYTFRTLAPDVLVRSRACKVSMEVRRSGALVAPTQAGSTFTLVDPAGTIIVNAAAVTVTASVATYTIPSGSLPSTLTLGEGYQERWALVLTDRTETIDREASLCIRPLPLTVSDADISGRYSQLARHLPAGETSWQGKIDLAWRTILRRLSSEGHPTYAIKSADQLYEPTLQLTLSYIFRDLAMAQRSGDGGPWSEMARSAESAYERAYGSMTFRTDDDLDGLVDDPAKRRGTAIVVVPGGAPQSFSQASYRRMGV